MFVFNVKTIIYFKRLGIVSTSNNSGHVTGEFYFSDESRLGIDYKQLLEFVQPLNGLVDAAVLAR